LHSAGHHWPLRSRRWRMWRKTACWRLTTSAWLGRLRSSTCCPCWLASEGWNRSR